MLFKKEFTVKEYQGIDENGKKIFEEINKVYIVKKNSCTLEKNVLELKNKEEKIERQKEVTRITSQKK